MFFSFSLQLSRRHQVAKQRESAGTTGRLQPSPHLVRSHFALRADGSADAQAGLNEDGNGSLPLNKSPSEPQVCYLDVSSRMLHESSQAHTTTNSLVNKEPHVHMPSKTQDKQETQCPPGWCPNGGWDRRFLFARPRGCRHCGPSHPNAKRNAGRQTPVKL